MLNRERLSVSVQYCSVSQDKMDLAKVRPRHDIESAFSRWPSKPTRSGWDHLILEESEDRKATRLREALLRIEPNISSPC